MIGALAAAFALAGSQAGEPPKVLYRAGPTRPIAEAFMTRDEMEAQERACRIEPRPTAYTEAARFPIESPSLGVRRLSDPETVRAEIAKHPLVRPYFLVGDDPTSHRWLAGNAQVLQQLGAVGMVVDVSSSDGFERVKSLAPGLPMFAASGEELAQAGIDGYPVLITKEGPHQ